MGSQWAVEPASTEIQVRRVTTLVQSEPSGQPAEALSLLVGSVVWLVLYSIEVCTQTVPFQNDNTPSWG
jgi:hypothetical protein